MWITQTYLGHVEPDAKAFVYYLFENYNSEQLAFTELVQRHLEEIGEVFRDNVSLLMPNPRYAARIESEVREKVTEFWWSFQGKLPGLLFTTRPLSQFDGKNGDYYFSSLAGCDAAKASATIAHLRRLIGDQLSAMHARREPEKNISWIKILCDATEAKVGTGGLKIEMDLKKIFKRH